MAEKFSQPVKGLPDTARTYERARPEAESGQGRMDNNDEATPAESADVLEQTVKNKQPQRQLNSDDVVDQRATQKPPR